MARRRVLVEVAEVRAGEERLRVQLERHRGIECPAHARVEPQRALLAPREHVAVAVERGRRRVRNRRDVLRSTARPAVRRTE